MALGNNSTGFWWFFEQVKNKTMVIQKLSKYPFFTNITERKNIRPFISLFSHEEQESVACCSQMSTLAAAFSTFCSATESLHFIPFCRIISGMEVSNG